MKKELYLLCSRCWSFFFLPPLPTELPKERSKKNFLLHVRSHRTRRTRPGAQTRKRRRRRTRKEKRMREMARRMARMETGKRVTSPVGMKDRRGETPPRVMSERLHIGFTHTRTHTYV
eukprot:Rmarinus@m.5951